MAGGATHQKTSSLRRGNGTHLLIQHMLGDASSNINITANHQHIPQIAAGTQCPTGQDPDPVSLPCCCQNKAGPYIQEYFNSCHSGST